MDIQKLTAPTPLFDTIDRIFDQSPPSNFTQAQAADFKICQIFLKSYAGNTATFNAYRREIERLLQYRLVIKICLIEFSRINIENFLTFCQKPPISWIGKKNASRFIEKKEKYYPNPLWHPFIVPITKNDYRNNNKREVKNFRLAPASLKALFFIIDSFFEFMISEEYINKNPVKKIRQLSKILRKTQNNNKIRCLSETQLHYLIKTAKSMAAANSDHERTLFIICCLYMMYLRISELVESEYWSPTMRDFQIDSSGHWWFKTVGKGNRERYISVSDDMLASLTRWRKHLKLSPLPIYHQLENLPLIISKSGVGIKTTKMIRTIIQDCFDKTIVVLKLDGLFEDAEIMAIATPHWLRHTGISDDVKVRPLEHVRDDAGHSSIQTTNHYINVIKNERAQSAKNKKRIFS